jgi:DNA helicase-2/ATP-dependent DNA helicase PcrA
VRFYERAEVKDVLAYARVVSNPADAVSLARIVNVPPRKIGERSLERLTEFAADRRVSLLTALALSAEVDGLPAAARGSAEALAGVLKGATERAGRDPVDTVLEGLLADTGYLEWLKRSGTEESEQRIANVQELVSAASEFVESSGEESLSAFLETVSLVANIDRWADGANAVSLMTLHNAKGLEFGVVLIPGMEDGLLPHESAFRDDEELEEERRLFYVGMTRAMDELHLFAADTRRRAGVMDLRSASRFLDEIDPSHLEARSLSAVPSRGAHPSLRGSRGGPAGRRRGRTARGPVADFPDYEGFSQEAPEFGPGTRVRHAKWGEGVVLELAGTSGDAIARIRFADDVEKRIMVRYGKLEIISD